MSLVLPVVVTLAVWWLSTGLILRVVDPGHPRAQRRAMRWASVLLALGMTGIVLSRSLDTVFGAYVAFISAVMVWAWQEIAFLRPLRLRPDPITVATWVSRVGGASYDFSYRILDETGYPCATAKTQVVFFDRPSESARRIPPQVRALLLEHLQESGDD